MKTMIPLAIMIALLGCSNIANAEMPNKLTYEPGMIIMSPRMLDMLWRNANADGRFYLSWVARSNGCSIKSGGISCPTPTLKGP